MFQLEKRKKICGSRRKEEEEVSSESEGDVPSNVLSQQDVSLSNVPTIENVLKQCSRFKQKKRKKRQRLAVLERGIILIGSVKDNGVSREQFVFTSI